MQSRAAHWSSLEFAHHAATAHSHPAVQVYAYRMGLMAEHLGGLQEPVFDQPQSRACLRRVNELADQNWRDFSGPKHVDMKGHLIRCAASCVPSAGCACVRVRASV